MGFRSQGSQGWARSPDMRVGQSKPSGCCGAARAALKALETDAIKEGHITELDYQQNTIEQILFRRRERILSAADRLREATEVVYEAIDERIATLAAQTTYRCRYLVLVGAILINGDHDMGSFTEPRRFTVRDLATNKTLDVYDDYMARIK